ncbi:lipocalin family protein [Christiangramia flava]|uniref:Uncharacterized protein n=1 Tax=Christiangramia flava JLT2011 TaxID=1229726 RepID=A0A1L7I9T9_9FLAO|nr:lipocalin family protein [Christiangramia flava]APU70349.1 hypothetical protein GRFL_3625 [Christiangramia flava JLT2011]OSS37524.1 secreted protein [Christiangramia flava JLT2011]
MKNFKNVTFAILVIFVAVSCSKDDKPSVNSSDAVGKWKLQEYYYSGDSQGSYDGMDLSSSYSVTTENSDAYLELLEDNTFKATGSIDFYMSMDYMGQSMDQTMANTAFNGTGNWSIDGNSMKLSNQVASFNNQYVQQAEVQSMTIEELTSSRMVLTFDVTQDMSQMGIDYSVSMKGKQVYTR